MSDGIYNKFQMIDLVVECLNGIPVSGSKSVSLLNQAFQMLFALKKGLTDEDNAKAKKIDLLKEQLKRATEPKTEPGGDVVGGEHYDINFGGERDAKKDGAE